MNFIRNRVQNSHGEVVIPRISHFDWNKVTFLQTSLDRSWYLELNLIGSETIFKQIKESSRRNVSRANVLSQPAPAAQMQYLSIRINKGNLWDRKTCLTQIYWAPLSIKGFPFLYAGWHGKKESDMNTFTFSSLCSHILFTANNNNTRNKLILLRYWVFWVSFFLVFHLFPWAHYFDSFNFTTAAPAQHPPLTVNEQRAFFIAQQRLIISCQRIYFLHSFFPRFCIFFFHLIP